MKNKINNIDFFLTYFKRPLQNWSILPSSKDLSKSLIKDIDKNKIKTIFELWPWTWPFTDQIVKTFPNAKIVLIEIDKNYAKILNKRFWEKVIIENVSAENIKSIKQKYSIEKIDLLISWLPFSIPKESFKKILKNISIETNSWSIFRFFTYMPPIMKMYYRWLNIEKKDFVLNNFPPAWVYWIN